MKDMLARNWPVIVIASALAFYFNRGHVGVDNLLHPKRSPTEAVRDALGADLEIVAVIHTRRVARMAYRRKVICGVAKARGVPTLVAVVVPPWNSATEPQVYTPNNPNGYNGVGSLVGLPLLTWCSDAYDVEMDRRKGPFGWVPQIRL